MDVLDLARIQFATTTILHFVFVPISIGLSLLIAIMETMYVVRKKELYKKMAKFWGHFLLINFALGVVTGILQEFQFGMNWSEFSRFVGDVFGTPLAIEALLAFFLESTFIGLWIFGWNKLPKKLHLMCIWLVSIGTMLSGFWILTANSFMQRPVGYEVVDGRAQMTDFWAVITNGQVLWEFPHTIFAAFATGGFLVAGISAFKMLRKKDMEFFKSSFTTAVIVAGISSMCVALFGHGQAQYLVETQPMKMAASEGLWNTSEDPAPWTVFAVIDPENQENTFEIKIPYILSYLSYSKFSGAVTGMNELQAEYEMAYGPGDYIPPVRTTFWSFRIMIASGCAMILLAFYGIYLAMRKRLDQARPWYLKIMLWAIALPFIGNTAGWIMTEIGRQPWTVFGLLTIEDSVSTSVTSNQVLFSVISFTSLYLILLGVLAFLFVREARKGPYHNDNALPTIEDPYTHQGRDRHVTE
ncbi:cytochrome ubiquinol oxidase subunit I [Paenibacillus polygoni]|uniref:Cytochrome ubiquinol oxidase subunit I n=1 Tax=Paenibacillus polygoni TaxID=3050112 RepID=A0ABY8WWM8_9BACL|nr:cytochrome ubiquinol oxidase subunit I [Paenibacillus polygoni]WIV17370.1 cytochrome ubiquinol oxidase subunit I [Paenibacillus polygoni]